MSPGPLAHWPCADGGNERDPQQRSSALSLVSAHRGDGFQPVVRLLLGLIASDLGQEAFWDWSSVRLIWEAPAGQQTL